MEKMPPLKYLMNLASTSSRLPPVPLFNEESQSQTQSSLEPVANTQATGEDFTTNSSHLTRFVVFTGIVATKLLIFLSAYVVCELKRRKLCRENGVNSGEAALVRKNKDQSAKAKAKQRRMSIKLIRSFHQQPTTDDDTALEEEMGLHGAEAEDVEVMLIESVINTRVAASIKGHPSIIAQLLPLMVVILKDPAKYHDEQLQLACALSLVRLMLLSEKLCTANLQLLFTLMEKSSIEKVKII
jgi:condensin complex subunit 1